MNTIEKLENPSFHAELLIERINSLAEKIKGQTATYYMDSRITFESYLLAVDMIILSMSKSLSEEETEHFYKYFIKQKMAVVNKILDKYPKY